MQLDFKNAMQGPEGTTAVEINLTLHQAVDLAVNKVRA